MGRGWGEGVWTTTRYKEARRISAQPITIRVREVPDGVEGALYGESGWLPGSLSSATGPLPASHSLWTLGV